MTAALGESEGQPVTKIVPGPFRRLGPLGIRYVPPALLVSISIALWQLLTVLRHVPDYLLPSPSEVWLALLDRHSLLISNSIPTAMESVIGLALAVATALILSVVMHFSRTVEIAVYPLLIGSQSVPLLALAPVLVVLLGYDVMPKLVIVSLVCFFPIVVNTVDGFRSADPDLIRLMRSLGARRVRIFREVEWPNALPYLLSGTKVAATFAVVGAVVGEWAGSSEGLGHLMYVESSQFDTPLIFAAMVVLTLMGIVLFLVVCTAERVLVPWREKIGRAPPSAQNQVGIV